MWVLAGILLAVWGWFMFSKGWGKSNDAETSTFSDNWRYPQDYYPHYFNDPENARKGEIQLP